MRHFPTSLLLFFCVLSGSQWLLPANDPSAAVELLALALGALLSGLTLSVCSLRHRELSWISHLWTWKLAFTGVGAIGAPALLLLMGRQQYSSVMAVATQACLPVVVAITGGAIAPGSELQLRLVPAMIALAGTLLVLPVGLPRSPQGWTGLLLYVAAVCLSGVSSVFCHRELVALSRRAGLLCVVIANAVFLGIIALLWTLLTGQWQSLRTVCDLPNVVLLLLVAVSILIVGALLQLLSPMAAASRVILAPLVGAVEACVLLRPTVSLRTAFGALLMLLGGLLCLRAESDQLSAKHMSLR